jgi:gas vesicle protein
LLKKTSIVEMRGEPGKALSAFVLQRLGSYGSLEFGGLTMSENSGSKFVFFLAGMGIGALVGILFAPQAGEDTRKYLSQKADEGRQYAQKRARELRERADDIVERGKDVVERQRGSLNAAFEAGKDAYQREKAKS